MPTLEGLPIWANALIAVIAIAATALGAHWVVESAARLAKLLGISELVIGLTVVAFGTSAPEFAVTIVAAFRGQGDISVGNIVGSNIFNLGFILGGCALFRAIPIGRRLLRRDGTVLGAITLLLLALIGWDLQLNWYDGAILFVLLLAYLGYLFKQRKAGVDPDDESSDDPCEPSKAPARDTLMLVGGLLVIVVGSRMLVESATQIAHGFGVSDWVIAVTIVAAGTSAPEFATSLAAVIKGRYSISAGNLIGSDIFNLLGVLGVAGMMRTLDIEPMARVSLGGLSAMVFLALFFMRTGWKVSRIEGALLVAVATMRWVLDFTAHGH